MLIKLKKTQKQGNKKLKLTNHMSIMSRKKQKIDPGREKDPKAEKDDLSA